VLRSSRAADIFYHEARSLLEFGGWERAVTGAHGAPRWRARRPESGACGADPHVESVAGGRGHYLRITLQRTLSLNGRRAEETLDRREHFVWCARLREKGGTSGRRGARAVARVHTRRDHDDRKAGSSGNASKPLEKLEAIHVRHSEIEHHDIRTAVGNHPQRGPRIRQSFDFESKHPKVLGVPISAVDIVVDDEAPRHD
jgi:hypothetical protein